MDFPLKDYIDEDACYRKLVDGRRSAEAFLNAHREELGHRSSFDRDTLLEQV